MEGDTKDKGMKSSQILMYKYKSDHREWNSDWKIIKLSFYGMVSNICLPESAPWVKFLTCLLSSAHLVTWNSWPTIHSSVQSHLCSRPHCRLIICCLSVNCKSSSTHHYLSWTWDWWSEHTGKTKLKWNRKRKHTEHHFPEGRIRGALEV